MSINDQQTWAGSAGGTGNAITLSIPNVSSLADLLGVEVSFNVTNTNSAAATITVNSIVATAVRKNSSGGIIALTGQEFIATNIASVKYNGTYFVITSPPSPVAASSNTVQAFTNSGTYNPSTGVQRIYIQAWAGGGGGFSVGSGSNHAGDGGGGAEYRFGVFSITPGSAITVTIGTGGAASSNGTATTVGSLITANPGHGATSYGSAGPGTGGTGGTGGVGIPGQIGGGGFTIVSSNSNLSGNGGGSFGTSGATQGGSNPAPAGYFPGGGGVGGNGGSGSGVGGAGAGGLVIIQELLN